MLIYTDNWFDEWIQENYPDAVFYTDQSGEVYVGLGVDYNGHPLT